MNEVDELNDAAAGSIAWLERLQLLEDDILALLADQLADKWQRMTGETRSDWAAVVSREYSESELASWRERLAEAQSRPVSPEELERLRDQLRQERDSGP